MSPYFLFLFQCLLWHSGLSGASLRVLSPAPSVTASMRSVYSSLARAVAPEDASVAMLLQCMLHQAAADAATKYASLSTGIPFKGLPTRGPIRDP